MEETQNTQPHTFRTPAAAYDRMELLHEMDHLFGPCDSRISEEERLREAINQFEREVAYLRSLESNAIMLLRINV